MKNNGLVKFLVNVVVLLITAYIVPGFIIANFLTAIIAAIVIAIVNALLKPIMMFISLPINILTFGLFTFIINGFLLWFASLFVPGFDIAGFWTAVLGSIVITLVSSVLNSLLVSNKDEN